MRRWLLLSASLHALFAAGLLVGPRVLPGTALPVPPQQEAEAEMVFVDPGGPRAGAAPPAPSPAPPQEAKAQPEPPPPPAPAPLPPPAEPEPAPPEAATAPTASEPQSPQPQSPPPSPPEVRLDDPDSPGETDQVRGDNLQVSPDPSAPNIPPRYPPAAARLGEQGLVILLVNVLPDGTASSAEVYQSSGFPVLDRAARDAVARWRFRPKNGGVLGAEAHTLVAVRFRLD